MYNDSQHMIYQLYSSECTLNIGKFYIIWYAQGRWSRFILSVHVEFLWWYNVLHMKCTFEESVINL